MNNENTQPEWAQRLESKIDEILEHFHVGPERQEQYSRADIEALKSGLRTRHLDRQAKP